MNRSTFRKLSLTWSAFAFLLGIPSFPALAQEDHDTGPRALYVEDLATLESKFLDLADAMSSEQYSWRPMEGVRSVSEVFMLIVAENYVVPSAWGAESPEGMTVDPSLFDSLPEVTGYAIRSSYITQSLIYQHQTAKKRGRVGMRRFCLAKHLQHVTHGFIPLSLLLTSQHLIVGLNQTEAPAIP